MKTLKVALLSWIFVGSAFALAILWNSSVGSRLFWCLLVFWAFGSILACTFEDGGLCLAQYLHLYRIAECSMYISHLLYKLPLCMHNKQRSMAAIGMAKIALMRGDISKTHLWAEKALQTDCADNWRMKFRSLSLMGIVCYRGTQYTQAEDYLREAWEVFTSNNEGMNFKGLAEILNEWQARNLDILAKLSILKNNLAEAEQLFKRSSKLRAETKSLEPSASAYIEYSLGALELAKKNMSEAEKHFLTAIKELPQELQLVQHREVALNILSGLKSLPSSAGKEAAKSLLKRYGKEFHSSQLD